MLMDVMFNAHCRRYVILLSMLTSSIAMRELCGNDVVEGDDDE